MFVVYLQMHDKQKASPHVVANHRITGLIIAAGIHQTQERIEENVRGLFESHAVVLKDVAARFGDVPNEGAPLSWKRTSMSFQDNACIYIVNTCKAGADIPTSL